MKVIDALWIMLQVLIGYNLIMPLLLYVIFLLKRTHHKKDRVHLKLLRLVKTPTAGSPLGAVSPPPPINQALRHPINIGFGMLPIDTALSAETDFAIIVTAYEQTTLLPEVINSILKINYSNYLVYIVADKCDIADLHFYSDKVIVLRPEETLASNTRSHFYAIRHFKRAHERLTIIDSDNLVHPEYLIELNKLFDDGYKAVQGIRVAKNLNTTYACLDAARDIYYHFFDGSLLFGAGASATLAGSGMAFTTKLYRECLEHLDITGAGFDKVLQYQIVNSGLHIAFSQSAIVYDEKTTNPNQLVKQRSRWINTWFRYFHYGLKLLRKGLLRFNWNQFLFGLILVRPPLFIFLILSVLFMIINLWIAPMVSVIWLIGILLFTTGFFIALYKSDTDRRIYNSLSNIPKFMFYQLLSLLKIRKANKYSVATPHFYKKDMESR